MNSNTQITFTRGKIKREELQLPIPYFVVADNWINVLGEAAYCDWLKLYSLCTRSEDEGNWEEAPVKMSLAATYERLGRKKKFFREKILQPLWEYGFIDIVQGADKGKAGHTPVNIVVYKYPCNDISRATQVLEKVRNWDTDYNSQAKTFGKMGGINNKYSKGSEENPLEKSENENLKGSEENPLKGSGENPNNNTKDFNIFNKLLSKYVSNNDSSILFYQSVITEQHSKYVAIQLTELEKQNGSAIVNEAIKRLAEQAQTKNHIAFIKSVIANWQKQGMQVFEDIEKVEVVYLEQKKMTRTKTAIKKAVRKEILPDWATKKEEVRAAEIKFIDKENERAELEEMLKQFKK